MKIVYKRYILKKMSGAPSFSKTSTFSITSFNVGFGPYMFMWGNACGLNLKGKAFMAALSAKMKLMPNGKEYGAQTVKDMVEDDSYLSYSTSPKRENDAAAFLAAHLQQLQDSSVLATQEISPYIILPAILNATKLTFGLNTMFKISLVPPNAVLEKKLDRGNSVLTRIPLVASGQIPYEKKGKPGKQQTRYVPWIITRASETDPLVFSASVQVSGYWAGAVTSKDENVVAVFKKDYATVQEELVHYIRSSIAEGEKANVDAIVLAGDWNQCGNTNDYVASLGLETHASILASHGFIEDTNSFYATTFDKEFPRRLDRVFVRVTPRSDWKFSSMTTRPLEDKHLDTFSDHVPVHSVIQFKK